MVRSVFNTIFLHGYIYISRHILQLWFLGLLAYLSTVMPRQIHCALGHSEPINHQLWADSNKIWRFAQKKTCSCGRAGGTAEGRRDPQEMVTTQNRSERGLFSSLQAPRWPRCKMVGWTGNLENSPSTKKFIQMSNNSNLNNILIEWKWILDRKDTFHFGRLCFSLLFYSLFCCWVGENKSKRHNLNIKWKCVPYNTYTVMTLMARIDW